MTMIVFIILLLPIYYYQEIYKIKKVQNCTNKYLKINVNNHHPQQTRIKKENKL